MYYTKAITVNKNYVILTCASGTFKDADPFVLQCVVKLLHEVLLDLVWGEGKGKLILCHYLGETEYILHVVIWLISVQSVWTTMIANSS